MGSKLRSVEAITDLAGRFLEPGDGVADLFSGSSVVSQAFASHGCRVASFDALAFCAHAARATLGVDRDPGEPVVERGRGLLARAAGYPFRDLYGPWVEQEDRALERKDGMALLELGARVPQVWRPDGAQGDLQALFHRLGACAGEPFVPLGPVAATTYAGTYFGLRQALALDAVRWAMEQEPLSPWARSAVFTALVSALSAAVFSAGKHFAQPHRISQGKSLAFHARRILDDRSVNVAQVFLEALARLEELPGHRGLGHGVENRAMESLLGEVRPGIRLVYADPPYTAQQYSRFYHIPEVLVRGLVPDLQELGTGVTSGLYPKDRFKSRFCSRREAPAAFGDLLDLARSWRASIIISYAESANGKTGNARMVSTDQLTGLLRGRGFRKVEIRRLQHNFRQLNHDLFAVDGRLDAEYVLFGEF
jgi:hypothetical protein